MAVSGLGQANRGRSLEIAIEQANRQYASLGLAQIQQVAVPTKVLPDGRGGVRIIREKSTVDFVGAWAGIPVAFDAKENRITSRFELDRIEDHQYEFLAGWERAGGRAFLLIWQESDQAIYLMPMSELVYRWQVRRTGGRASVPVDQLRRLPRCKPGRGCTVDYLAALEAWMKEVQTCASTS